MKKVGVKQRVAPVRLCFLVVPDEETSFTQAIEIAFSLWGGMYCPILPFYNDLPTEFRKEFGIPIATEDFYRNTLENYDVDAIVIDDKLDRNVVGQVIKNRVVLTITEFLTGIDRRNHHYGVGIELIAEHLAETAFKFVRNDNAHFNMPTIDSNELFLKAWRGTLPQKVNDTIGNIFSDYNVLSTAQIDWGNVVEYIKANHLDPRFLSNYKLWLWPNQVFRDRSLLYCFDSTRLQDIINFWNLRAAGNFVTPIPINIKETATLQELFNNYYTSELKLQEGREIKMMTCLAPRSSDKIAFELQSAYHAANKEAKGGSLGKQLWFPRFWEEHEILLADHIKAATPFSQSNYDYIDVIDGRLEFAALPLPFEVTVDLRDRSSYQVQIELTHIDEYAEYAGLLADLSREQIKRVINSYSFSKDWRLSAGVLHTTVMINDSRRKIDLFPPKAVDFFSLFFDNRGYRLRETPNSKLAQEVFKNMEGLNGFMFYRSKGRLAIIEMFEERKEVGYVALIAEMKRKMSNLKNTEFFIHRLLEHKIIEFGALIKCKVCEQSGYFLTEDILPQLRCPICRNNFELPMSNPGSIRWAYRGIGPFTRNNKAGGVMSVFATLWLFLEHIADEKRISSLFGFELHRKSQTIPSNPMEIDLCLLAGDKLDNYKEPDLIFCECKTYIELKQVDIDRMQELGNQFPGAILVFATLNDSLSANEVTLLKPLVQHFQTGDQQRPRNPILILTGKELLSENFHFPLKEYEDQMHAYQRHNDFLGTLCEMSIRKHLKLQTWGEIRMERWNQEIARRQTIGNIVDAVLQFKKKEVGKLTV